MLRLDEDKLKPADCIYCMQIHKHLTAPETHIYEQGRRVIRVGQNEKMPLLSLLLVPEAMLDLPG